jgi:hypothetical protein
MRGEYFDLMRRLSAGEVFHLERSVDEEARKDELTQKQNQLLDLFAEWQRTKSREMWAQIQAAVEEIQQLDPNFRFSVPEA